MTNKAYFISLLGYAPSADAVEGALTDAGITADGNYTTANTVALKTAAVSTLQSLLTTPDITQGTGETTFATKYDRSAILKRIAMLEDQLGISAKPTIKGIQPW